MLIPVEIKTHLDLYNERWPIEMPAVPQVGHLITSKTIHQNHFQLQLEVVQISWEPNQQGVYVKPTVELGRVKNFHGEMYSKDPQAEKGSIRAFYEWYAPLVGKSVANFI